MNTLIALLLVAAPRASAAPFDHSHAALASVLAGAAGESGVDYAALAGRKAQLEAYLGQVAQADTAGWTDAQKLALYINAYNAYTLLLVVQSGPPASIRDLDGGKVWDTRSFRVAGQSLTLNQIENSYVRKLGDARVHAALNCASRGCPALSEQPLTEAKLQAQLEEATQRWVRTNA